MKLVIFTGAGLSTASGIPDFRSKGGIWDRFDPDEFHISRFRADPAAFWQRRARLIAAMDYLDARPNAAHHAIADAARQGAVVVTQNVDGLHSAAGTPPERLIEVHGNGRSTICLSCQKRERVEATLSRLGDAAPLCLSCGGLMKPDVVLFGEPVTRMDAAFASLHEAEQLLVAGTSLQVYPAAGLVHQALALEIPVTICNRDPTPMDTLCRLVPGDVTHTVPATIAGFGVQ